MKSIALALALVFAASATLPGIAEARRIGGGGAVGMQRSLPPRAPEALPARPIAPAATPAPAPTAAAAPALAPKRSWLGPIAGIAAGIGLAALMSHLGFGAEFGNIIMLLLLAVVAVVAIRFVMRRFGSAQGGSPNLQFAGAGSAPAMTAAPFASGASAGPTAAPTIAGTGAANGTYATRLPADFDAAGFERIAKMIFIRLQAANDVGDLNDLRAFTTPEMFAVIKLELQERGASTQRTDVVRVDAEVLDVASEAERQVVSVRFHGLIQEQADAAAEPFDEVWHLVKPADGSREWAIAGIQPATLAHAA
jgi:predicted lipid-binding transport protein (Tim44 family)